MVSMLVASEVARGVELVFQAGVVGAGPAAVYQVQDVISPFFPGFLDLWGLGGLYYEHGPRPGVSVIGARLAELAALR